LVRVPRDGAASNGRVRPLTLEAVREGSGRGAERARRVRGTRARQYRVSFVLGTDANVYTDLCRLLARVRHWEATEVFEGEEPVSAYHAREIAWCGPWQLNSFGECRFRFSYGVFPRCSLCPLFDRERAIRDLLGENPLLPVVVEIAYGPKLQALRRQEGLIRESEQGWEVPNFPPKEWDEPTSGDRSG
jgi:hypothetical protein